MLIEYKTTIFRRLHRNYKIILSYIVLIASTQMLKADKFTDVHQYLNDCVDLQSADNLGNGSILLARQIAKSCIKSAQSKFHPEPGIIEGPTEEFLAMRVQENFDCRAIHPYGEQMVCNSPIDQNFIDEGWPSWQKEFGGSREDYDTAELKELLHRQANHERLLTIKKSSAQH